MQAVILAGGLGTRLWPITKEIPKPMVPVRGVPYLEHQLRLLRQQEITDVVLLTGYLGEQIEEYFGDGRRLGLRIGYSREKVPLGTGGALRDARDLLNDAFLLIYGDSFLPIDYRAVADLLRSSGRLGVVVVYDNALGDTAVRNNIALDASGLVSRYSKERVDDPNLTHVEAGVLSLRRAVVDLIPSSGKVSLETEIFPLLIARQELVAFVTRQRFYDIGTPDRLATFEHLFSHDYHADPISN